MSMSCGRSARGSVKGVPIKSKKLSSSAIQEEVPTPKRIATRQETFDAIMNEQPLEGARVWRDSIITYDPLGRPKRELMTQKTVEELDSYNQWLVKGGRRGLNKK